MSGNRGMLGLPSKAQAPRRSVILADSDPIVIDASQGDVFRVTFGGNRTFAAPVNPTPGQRIIVAIKQDATGSRTATWNAVFRWGTDVTLPTLTQTAAKTDYLGFIYNGPDATWDALAVAKGY